MEIKITLSIKDKEVVLTLDEAKQLQNELGKLFGNCSLVYPPGIRGFDNPDLKLRLDGTGNTPDIFRSVTSSKGI